MYCAPILHPGLIYKNSNLVPARAFAARLELEARVRGRENVLEELEREIDGAAAQALERWRR